VGQGCIFVERYSFLKYCNVVSCGNLEPKFRGKEARTNSGYDTVSYGNILQEGVASSFSGCGTTKCGRCVAPVRGDHAASISRQGGIRGQKLLCVMTSSLLYSVHLPSLS
jgi:hypothetical protein